MKKTFYTTLAMPVNQIRRFVTATVVFLAFYGVSLAQAGVAIDLGYLPSVNWKAPSDISTVISEEQSKILIALSAPNMPLDEKAAFLAHQRMLNYIQINLQAGKTADEAIVIAYEQVLAEAPKDAELAYLPSGLLGTFIPGLVESFTKPEIASN